MFSPHATYQPIPIFQRRAMFSVSVFMDSSTSTCSNHVIIVSEAFRNIFFLFHIFLELFFFGCFFSDFPHCCCIGFSSSTLCHLVFFLHCGSLFRNFSSNLVKSMAFSLNSFTQFNADEHQQNTDGFWNCGFAWHEHTLLLLIESTMKNIIEFYIFISLLRKRSCEIANKRNGFVSLFSVFSFSFNHFDVYINIFNTLISNRFIWNAKSILS